MNGIDWPPYYPSLLRPSHLPTSPVNKHPVWRSREADERLPTRSTFVTLPRDPLLNIQRPNMAWYLLGSLVINVTSRLLETSSFSLEDTLGTLGSRLLRITIRATCPRCWRQLSVRAITISATYADSDVLL